MNWKFMTVALAAFFALAFLCYVQSRDIDDLTTQRDAAYILIKQNEEKQARVAEIDKQRTMELTDAKAEINRLRDAVADGAKRLRVKATCKPTTAPGVVDAASPGLTDSAIRNYFTLRERIEATRVQIAGLQDYISNVCLNQSTP